MVTETDQMGLRLSYDTYIVLKCPLSLRIKFQLSVKNDYIHLLADTSNEESTLLRI